MVARSAGGSTSTSSRRQADLAQVQADELRVRAVGGVLRVATALTVTSRLWLGGVVRPHRDRLLIRALLARVRANPGAPAVRRRPEQLRLPGTACLPRGGPDRQGGPAALDAARQYFERVRLELHPENARPDDVLLGQFGRRLRPADPPAPSQPGGIYFAETGHDLSEGFLSYWVENGGLPQFGYPISEVFTQRLEDDRSYRVQYFERARFEYHPENRAPFDILLSQFGRRVLAEADSRR